MVMTLRIVNQVPPYLHLPRSFHLSDSLYALHALGQLGLVYNSRLSSRLNDCPRLIHAVQVCRPTDVLATVLRVDPAERHGHITEIIDGRKAILCKERSLVKYPANTQLSQQLATY